ncbi:MAG: YraN family protein [Paramuribaculum sp.]|nr:YraN family protein [Paramuribaculum sp.]
MARHNDTGKWGEDIACELLISKGYTVTERNVKMGHNEIDIVALKGSRVVFVEVKTRSSVGNEVFDAIDERKMRHLCNAAEAYIRAHNIPHEPQMDVIVVEGTKDTGYKTTHIADAFMPPLKCR